MSADTDRPTEPPRRERLKNLSDKISKTREKRDPPPREAGNAKMLGLAWRLTIEILAGIGVGGFVGWWLDKWFGTAPLFLLVLLFLGMAAGLLNSVRTVAEMRRKMDDHTSSADVFGPKQED